MDMPAGQLRPASGSLRKLVTSILMVAGIALGMGTGATPAGANNLFPPHWGTVNCYGGQARCVYVYDRTTDGNTSTALRNHVAWWNQLRNNHYGALPYLIYVNQFGSNVCGDFGSTGQVITVCSNGISNTSLDGDMHWFNPNGNHFGSVVVRQRSGLDYSGAYTNIVHEMGHAMGLDHGGGAVMEHIHRRGQHYSSHDLGAIVGRYYSHYPG